MAPRSQPIANERLMGAVRLENRPTYILVVAAAITDDAGRVLLQQRPVGKRHAGMWEFPGGKVEVTESPMFALVRELREELAISAEEAMLGPVGFAEEAPHDGYPGIVLLLYRCPVWSGEPQSLDGQSWGWFTCAEAAELSLPAMDRKLLSALG